MCDVADLTPDDLPGVPTLVWASFPCQDLSLAGNGAGLEGNRSGTFKPFWELMRGMVSRGRHPQLIVLENVVGRLTSHDGRDFALIVAALAKERYRVGALVMDAVRFVPQSRPRLFIVGVYAETTVPSALMLPEAAEPWHTKPLRSAVQRLPERLQDAWVWWSIPAPCEPIPSFSSLIEEEPTGVEWHTKAQTDHIISLMSPLHLQKLKKAQLYGKRIAKRATTIAALARIISEREVSKGLRRTLMTQAQRLERLATQHYNEIGGDVPTVQPGQDV